MYKRGAGQMIQKYSGLVIVVDDDPYVLESISLLLQESGYSVVACGNAQDALDKFHERGADAVLTDIRMPGLSGIDLLERIHAAAPEIPVILMTAYAELDNAVEAIKKGAFDFIIKPYKTEQLIHSVEKAIEHSRLVQMENDYQRILEDLNRALESLVVERTMSLMALTVADKVRNPAAVIGGICRRMIEKGDVSDKLKESLKDIISESEKLESIVRDFQGLLKSKQSMFGYEDINEAVRSVLSVIEKETRQKGIELVVSLSAQPLKINMHEDLFKVAVFHIMRNAIEAASGGGRITVKTYGDADTINLSVSDTGPGIPQEDIKKVFEPFFSTKEHRFGMGLPLVRQIVSEHFGEIKVESEIGKGTTFTIVFPVRWMEKGEDI
jgi:signal transduction histidine kinase